MVNYLRRGKKEKKYMYLPNPVPMVVSRYIVPIHWHKLCLPYMEHCTVYLSTYAL